jgi:PPOX class probable F420-dependent enzyme
MQMDADRCREQLAAAHHGVLGTVHADRGVDAVPVVFVVVGDLIVIPIDTVKPKAGARLQRLRNLEADHRAVLLVDHYDDDWSALWWVRVHGPAHEAEPSVDQLEQLATAFPAYEVPGAVTSVIVLRVDQVSGWTAGPVHG